MTKVSKDLVVGVAVSFLFLWLLIIIDKKNKEIKKMQQDIDENQNLNKEIRRMLSELIGNNKVVDPNIANELGRIVALLEIKDESTAVFKLSKIIENLLKELYEKDEEFKEFLISKQSKKPVFNDFLEFAKLKKLVSKEDFHLLSVMKIIRNEEAHEIDVTKEKSRVLACFIAGLSFTLGLCRLLKKKSIGI